MTDDTIYAVVDLETTGTNNSDDRIIQIGCVFIRNGEIIETYTTDVNPRKKVSTQIEALTKITNEQLQSAPYFEDIADRLYELLNQSVFVAHNIYFDYQFLNHEFVRAGYPGLTIPGVDTVELAQIFFPTLSSYRLSDIAEHINVTHNRPHQADSDALVTAELFKMIENKIKKLPLVTLEKIVSLSQVLGRETSLYLAKKLDQLKESIPPLSEELHIIEGIALKKKASLVGCYPEKVKSQFPMNKQEKQQSYGALFDYRNNQSEMMDLVHDFFVLGNPSGKNLAIEAPTGSGKTFGYLYPLCFVATPENPVLISTTSILLEQQLLNEAVPMVNQVNKNSLVGTMIKSSRYFIDLTKFSATLAKPLKQKQYALHQMSCLVWLLETSTGDMTELNLANLEHQFFGHVRHLGEKYVSEASPFYQEDFWLYLKLKVKHSNVLIVNHAFLIKENFREFPWLPKSDYLIIDEAHHLPEISEKLGNHYLNLNKLKQLFYKIKNFPENYPDWEKISKQKEWPFKERLINKLVNESQDVLNLVQEDIFETAVIDSGHRFGEEILVTQETLDHLPIYLTQDVYRFMKLLEDLLKLLKKIQTFCLANWDKWLPSEQLLMQLWIEFYDEAKDAQKFIENFLQKEDRSLVKWLKVEAKKQLVTLFSSDLSAPIIENSAWYERYTKVLYTGGTLASGKDEQYLAKNLGIAEMPFVKFPSHFDYAKQARFYVPQESYSFSNLSSVFYEQYVAKCIESIALKIPSNVLVLFTSHEMLQHIYHQIQPILLDHNIEVLAQGVSGSHERIMKRFMQPSGQKVLLGADSYWEGIDLPGDALELIVVVRLPFESPERPFVKEKLRFLQSKGIDGFKHYSLPKAVIRLRQGVGRLIRSKQDKGAIVMLDPRIVTARYGDKIKTALPEDLKLREIEFPALLTELEEFLTDSNLKKIE